MPTMPIVDNRVKDRREHLIALRIARKYANLV